MVSLSHFRVCCIDQFYYYGKRFTSTINGNSLGHHWNCSNRLSSSTKFKLKCAQLMWYVCVCLSAVDTESSLESIDGSDHYQRESKEMVLRSSTNSIRLQLTNFIIQYKLDELTIRVTEDGAKKMDPKIRLVNIKHAYLHMFYQFIVPSRFRPRKLLNRIEIEVSDLVKGFRWNETILFDEYWTFYKEICIGFSSFDF